MTLKEQIMNSFVPGQIFTLDDLGIPQNKKASACVIISKMKAEGRLAEFSKGAYYIPKMSALFGELPPDKEQILCFLCKKTNGYVTGNAIYNKMGLTEQVPNVTEIATRKNISKKVQFGNIIVEFRKAYAAPDEKKLKLLHVLDAITDIKRIPARNISENYRSLKEIVNGLSKDELDMISSYSIQYPPRTRFVLSDILADNGKHAESSSLRKTINNTTRFSYEY